ncbi:hypothetical protein [Psychrobacter immobilis]|uniref:hypothetical protein n=1 Tax=Psychrobacter immobilis TaxID=498 RepID=UPI0035ABDCB6
MFEFERIVRSGIRLVKYWFSITDDEQIFALYEPFMTRLSSGNSHRVSCNHGEVLGDYTKAKETMFERTIFLKHLAVVEGTMWETGEINCIAHLLEQIPIKKCHAMK